MKNLVIKKIKILTKLFKNRKVLNRKILNNFIKQYQMKKKYTLKKVHYTRKKVIKHKKKYRNHKKNKINILKLTTKKYAEK